MRVLIAESDLFISSPLIRMLRNASYTVDHATSGSDTINMLKYYDYDLLITEMSLEDMEGHDIIRQIRRAQITTPIMVISTLMQPQAKVMAFAAGADDYVIKPYDNDELLARVQALMRRAHGFAEPRIKVGPLELDLSSRMISIDGQFLHLTSKEYAIMELLIVRRGAILTKDTFLNHLYGGIDEPEMKIIDVFICKLRRKLQRFGAGHMITTVWGRGYILAEEPEQPASPALSSSTHAAPNLREAI
ncbi:MULTISPECIES: response regulator transcription factor [unclassified Saccharibacter]|uniref:response regulator transcription factor n=1 Tax=unclassified Saccharibacter TaxID=2648722 RepID=UPI0013297415|nr:MULTISPECIES: response regulator transcription factor [unclassified Saccharibacter]MXV35200.1 response regulator [Saccharibacter sp. EH611]MXV57253.1 response regulator [Saccharibacter sp. EH70]MXV64886.1 response regulator [Saccharibacter sp. EH60]